MKFYIFILSFLSIFALQAQRTAQWICDQGYTWSHNDTHSLHAIFFPGIFACQSQAGKYMGSHGFCATTGEHVYWDRPIDGIYQLFVSDEIDEVMLHDKRTSECVDYCNLRAIGTYLYDTIFSYVTKRSNKRFGITIDDYPQALKTVAAFSIIFSKINFGQERDIAYHKRCVEAYYHKYWDGSLVLYGFSRGAAATFNAVASNLYPDSQIKAVVLEGCYDNCNYLLQDVVPFLQYKKLFDIVASLLHIFTEYRVEGIQPIDLVEHFPKTIPVLFITSECDRIVPKNRVKALADALVQAGHEHVYFVCLKHASHPGYTMDNQDDALLYQSVLHAFYKQFDLPYIQEYANGIIDLDAFLLKIG